MNSPGRRQNHVLRSPMSPFRSSNDDCDQMFQLSLADVQSNGTVIPLQSNILSCLKYLASVILVPDAIKARKVNNTNRFYSQPTSPSTYSSSISRHSFSFIRVFCSSKATVPSISSLMSQFDRIISLFIELKCSYWLCSRITSYRFNSTIT